MAILKIQLNHPGNQKPYSPTDGYCTVNSQIIREWNKDVLSNGKCPHYRKFIRSNGEYIKDLESKPKKNSLLFWGEWEGNSFFHPINNGNADPNGIHEPFHSLAIRGFQNTDPYVFGDFFKYAICSQKGVMCSLTNGSLILFGTTTNAGFLLDTVFVVKDYETASAVFKSKASNYTNVYREETIEQLKNTYLVNNPLTNNKIYHAQTWLDDKEYFSFVPCKIDNIDNNNNGFPKAVLTAKEIPSIASQKVGHPYKHFNNILPKVLWNDIVKTVIDQGFLLGIKFDEPMENNDIISINSQKNSLSHNSCGNMNKQEKGKLKC